MTAPDLPAAVNLVVHQVTETDILDAAVVSFQTRVPEWNPVEGDLEAALIEAVAVAVGQDVYAINQVPIVVLEGLLQLWGVSRKPGLAATATVKVTMPSGTTGARTLAAGTGFRVINTNGVVLTFLTVSDAIGNPSVSLDFYVPVAVSITGSLGNAIPAGTTVALTEPLSWIESSQLFTITTGGTEDEADNVFFARAAAFLRSQTSALVVPAQFESFAMQQTGVGRAKCVTLWDSVGTVGGQTGHVTVAVADSAGAALLSGPMTSIQSAMSALVVAGLAVHVVAPTYSSNTVTVSVDAQPGVVKADLKVAVEAMLRGWYSPAAWPWGQQLYTNDLITKVQSYPGVLRVTATGGSAVGTAVTSPIQLPAANAPITVTVN